MLLQWPIRALVLAAGLLLATPGGGLIPWSDAQLAATAGLALASAVGLVFLTRRLVPGQAAESSQPSTRPSL